MLSILIPVYNVDVTKLVSKLFMQCKRLDIRFEILVYDDLSDEKYRKKNIGLGSSIGINYLELTENLGRSKIRNWLVKSALFDYVLLLDCDVKVIKNDFIKTYLDVKDKAQIINGGRVYSKKKPSAKSKHLHWNYGTKKESKRANSRNLDTINYFHSNNFFATRSVLDKYPFDESLDGYGYEDLVFAMRMQSNDVTIHHIDNPVEHLGLETNKVFLSKMENAIENLVKFENKDLLFDTRLQRLVQQVERLGLTKFIRKYCKKKYESHKSNLLNNKGGLWQLSLMKLHKYYEYKYA